MKTWDNGIVITLSIVAVGQNAGWRQSLEGPPGLWSEGESVHCLSISVARALVEKV